MAASSNNKKSSNSGIKNKKNSKEKSVVDTLEEQLTRAETAVRNNEFKVQTLHSQWITFLVRLSYMVLLLAFHQMQSPSTACIMDVKNFNDHATTTTAKISGYKVVGLVFTDSLVHILGITMACFLSFFLQKQQTALEYRKQNMYGGLENEKKKNDDSKGRLPIDANAVEKKQLFSDARYLVANACIAPLLAMYYAQKQRTALDDSCLDPTLLQKAGVEPMERQRSLPVVVVFHVLVTVCIWFMDRQQGQVADNVLKVYKLRRDLLVAQEEQDKKEQLLSSSKQKK
ncbi:hypothetical protein ACA910_017913 [Epithemia clementina (nom. ined.)]